MQDTLKSDEIIAQLYNRDWFEYANKTLSYISAFALIALLIATTVTTAFDVVYLIVPGFKQFYTDFIENKQGNKLARASVRLLISKVAIQSYDEAMSQGQVVMYVYLKNRISHYVFITIMIVILATGLDTILLVVYRLLRGFLEQL